MEEIIDSKVDLHASKFVIIDFWADWCQPCKMLMPVVSKMEQEFTSIKFYKANVDENPGLTTKYSVTGIPCLLIFKDGAEFNRLSGLQTEKKLRDFLTALIAEK